MRERDIQSRVVDYARKSGCIARKLDFGQGWPDYLFLYAGRVLFIEFKGDRGKLMELQKHVRDLLQRQGFDVELCEGVLAGQAMIDHLVGQPRKGVVSYADITKALIESKR